MKIIITVESFFPLKNGVQEITQNYAEFLSKNNDVTVITKSVQGSPEEEYINGVKVLRVNVNTKKSIYYGEIDKYKEILLSITEDADVLMNVCMQTAFTDCIINILKDIKCKKILYLHGMAHFVFPRIPKVDFHDILSWILNVVRWKLFYLTVKKKLNLYDAIIHLHKSDKTFLMCQSLSCKNYVIENIAGNDIAVQNDDDLDDTSPYIMIANYIHDKNQELAIRSYYKSDSKRKLVFVGSKETNYLNKLKILCSKYDKKYFEKQVEFVVNESHAATMQRLKKAYALIHSSKSEKYPVVICEAMKTGIPFIATDTGIIKELPGGLVCKTEDDFINSINKLESSPELRKKMIDSGASYSSLHQDYEKNKVKLADILKEL